MRRRRFIAGFGGLVASTVTVGTGAFSSVEADRGVTVAVENDYDAYLGLEELGEGERSELDGGVLKLNVPGDDEAEHNDSDPDGLGTNSVYRFDKDAGGDPGDGLFAVTNQGTQPVALYSTQESTDGVPTVTIFDVETDDLLTAAAPSPLLDTGETLRCGIEVDTHGVDSRDQAYDVTLSINAEATE